MYYWKAIVPVPGVTADRLFHIIWDDYAAVQYQLHPTIENAILLHNGEDVKRLHLFSKGQFLVASRDFVWEAVCDHKEFISGTKQIKKCRWYYWSVEHPFSKGYVRGTVNTKWEIEEDPKDPKSSIIYQVFQTDPRGSLPTWVLNNIGPEFVKSWKMFVDFCKKGDPVSISKERKMTKESSK